MPKYVEPTIDINPNFTSRLYYNTVSLGLPSDADTAQSFAQNLIILLLLQGATASAATAATSDSLLFFNPSATEEPPGCLEPTMSLPLRQLSAARPILSLGPLGL